LKSFEQLFSWVNFKNMFYLGLFNFYVN